MTENLSITRLEPRRKLSFLEWKEIVEYRDLLYFLALRDIQLRYKQTALGIIWVILQPLVPAIIFAVIFGNFAKLPSSGHPYILLVLCGLLPWNIFCNALQRSGTSLVNNANLVSKVYFPRILVPISSLGSVIIDALVSLAVLILLLVCLQVSVGWQILLLPGFLVATFLMGLGSSLVISSLNVYYRDFSFLVPFALQIWTYLSPVAYSTELIPEKWRWLFALNPVVGLIEGVRWSVLGSSLLSPEMIISSMVGVVGSVILGTLIFRRVERGFADIV